MSCRFSTVIHPLMRGADIYLATILSDIGDSSPHTRGQTLFSLISNTLRMIHPLLRGADLPLPFTTLTGRDSSPLARGRLLRSCYMPSYTRFIPSCEGQTLNVYAAFRRLKHLVVQFAQMSFSTRHTSFPLLIICLKNIFFVFFTNIF